MKWKSRVWVLKIGMRDFGRASLLPRSGVVVFFASFRGLLGWMAALLCSCC